MMNLVSNKEMQSCKVIKKTQIGKTDLYVNPIGLGTNAVGGHNLFPNLDEEKKQEEN